MEALPKFKPLFILRYSATHRTQHNRVHRLDALDAYNQKLVKKISVRGIQTRGLAGTNAYLYLEGIDISKRAPVARIEMEVKLKSGEIKRQLRRLEFRDDLFVTSGELGQYQGFTISQIEREQVGAGRIAGACFLLLLDGVAADIGAHDAHSAVCVKDVVWQC